VTQFPKHLCLSLRHNPHRGVYVSLETWLENYLGAAEANGTPRDETILPEDLAEIRRTGEVWELSWCPSTPVGSCTAVAATLERVLELAERPAEEPRNEDVELVALRKRVADLEWWLRYALEEWAPSGSDKADKARKLLGDPPR
jgi:hypothetical protein